jgi:allantoinase
MLPAHSRYAYTPIDARPDYFWPNGKRLAFYIGTNVETFAFNAGLGADPGSLSGVQTHRNYAWRDYGNRVGIWRLFDVFEEFGLPTSCLVNSLIYDYHPEITDRIRARGDEVIAHGRTNSEWQRGLWELDEKRLIDDATSTILKHEGRTPQGWLGGSVTETNVTLDLLKEAGYRYVLDWPCDDQPIWMNTRSGPLLSVPYPMELNDMGAIIQRQHTANEFGDMIVDQFDDLIRRCENQSLVFSISLHPFIIGQPFRLTALSKALRHIVKHPLRDRIWFTRARDISEHCHALRPGLVPGS